MATVLPQDTLADWGSAEAARDRGAVFTPDFLAEWVSGLLRENCEVRNPTIADFGCGSGNLLSAAERIFPASQMIGVEIDGPSTAIAKAVLGTSAKLVMDDFLSPRSSTGMALAAYWIQRLGGRPDALIMNPPWGAAHSITKHNAPASGLGLARGQFDTYDLFCELALQTLRPG